ncbi:MAG: hypothetical protein L0177_17290, partial [Chloroflexi bacterium]|nr:hypothetical protein [Chloroflexota bacterium]
RIITARRKQLAQLQRNVKRRRLVLAISGVAMLLVLGVIISGYVVAFVLPPSQLVVRVDDVSYTRGDMVKLMRIKQRQAEFLGSEFQLSDEVFRTLQLLLENEIIAQAAPSYGIAVSDEEIDDYVRRLLEPRAGVSPDPDQRERDFRETYRSYLNTLQIIEDEHRQLTRKTLLREKFRIFIGDNVPRVADQVHVHRLVMLPGDEIDIMQTKLNDAVRDIKDDPLALAQAFRDIVREFSRDDPEIVRLGGNLGWVPKGVFREFDRQLFDPALQPGQLVGPLEHPDLRNQSFFFMISEKAEARQVEPHNRNALMSVALEDWLSGERPNHEVYAVMNSQVHDWVIAQLGITSRVTPTPQLNIPFPGGFN